jgi:hypothetical protein
MVKGLKIFQEHFVGHTNQFVLIGGTAATLAMSDAGLDFRGTKDLDIVLHLEALTPAFGEAFWAFVEKGGYELKQASDTGKAVLYRFLKPADPSFPAMLELFCRSPGGIHLPEGATITPIPFDEAVSSLSAILLDEQYYQFIINGRREKDGLPWVGEDRLIPLKASAWLDLSARRAAGESVDAKNIRKHANDVIRLSQLLAPDTRVPLPPTVRVDLHRFLNALEADGSYDPKPLGINISLHEVVQRVALAYAL